MRLANITLEEMTEALNRGWAERDSRVAMLLQEERAGVEIRVTEEAIREALAYRSNVVRFQIVREPGTRQASLSTPAALRRSPR